MKYKINICEKITYNHETTIESDSTNIDHILDEAEKADCLDDVLDNLRERRCEIVNFVKDEDGSNTEIEIDDLEELKEGLSNDK